MFRTQSTKTMLAAATMTVALLAGCGGSSNHPSAAGAPTGAGASKAATPISAAAPAAATSSGGAPSSPCDFLKNGPWKSLGDHDSASTIASNLRSDASYIRQSFPAELHDDGNLLASMLEEGASKLDSGATPNAALVASIMQEHQAAYRSALGDFVRYSIVHCAPTATP